MSGQKEAFLQKDSSFIERLGQQLGINANVRQIYGEPIDRDGVTVIPVAKIGFGFGGGSGKKENEEGEGGGGGVRMIPVGYIEIKNGETRFRSPRDPLALMPVILAAAPWFLVGVWKLRKLFNKKP